jgi:antitoxin HigA-1
MSYKNDQTRQLRPTHPGEILGEDFLPEYDLSIAGLAEAVNVSRQSVNELIRGRRSVTPAMALKLARLFGNSPEFWLDAQRSVDLWDASLSLETEVKQITPLNVT